MLENESLFFSSADQLGDPFEGIFPRRNLDRTGIVFPAIPEKGQARAHAYMESARLRTKRDRRFFCISCWYESEHESDAMWKLYADGGIAIQTTPSRLRDALNAHLDDDIYLGRVHYADYDKTFLPEGNQLSVFLYKRISFEHEREVRALVWVQKDGVGLEDRVAGGGINVSVTLDALINDIVVSPLAPQWYFDLIKQITRRYGLVKPVRYSRLADALPY